MRIVPTHWTITAAAVLTTLFTSGCAGGFGGNLGLASWKPSLPSMPSMPWSKNTTAAEAEIAAAEAMGVPLPSSQIAAANPNNPMQATAPTTYGQLSTTGSPGVTHAGATMPNSPGSDAANYQVGAYSDPSTPQYGNYQAGAATSPYGAYGSTGSSTYPSTAYPSTASPTTASMSANNTYNAPAYGAGSTPYGSTTSSTYPPATPPSTPSYGSSPMMSSPPMASSTYPSTGAAATVADSRYGAASSYPSTASPAYGAAQTPTTTNPGSTYSAPGSTGYTPGATGYSPGQTGFQPQGVPAYQSPAPAYQSPAPAYQSPTPGGYPSTDMGSASPAPYRPGSTTDYPQVASSDASSPAASTAVYEAPAGMGTDDVTAATALAPPVATGVPQPGLTPAPADLQLSPTPSATTYR